MKATFVEYSKRLPLDKRRQFDEFIVASLISKAANMKVVELCGATPPEEKKLKERTKKGAGKGKGKDAVDKGKDCAADSKGEPLSSKYTCALCLGMLLRRTH